MKETATKVISQAAEKAEEHLGEIGDRMSEVTEATKDMLHDAKRAVKRDIDRAVEKVEDAAYEAERYVRRNPLKATLVAFGVGALVGCLITLAISRRD